MSVLASANQAGVTRHTHRMKTLFNVLADDGKTSAQAILDCIAARGIDVNDWRLGATREKLAAYGDSAIEIDDFVALVSEDLMIISKIVQRQLVIPDWSEFSQDIRLIYDKVGEDRSGANADYIPILRDADPEKWGLALCTVDGQRLSLGDADMYHSIQSISKPITYAYALTHEGEQFTHRFVGTEPSGRPFNALDLMADMRPYNPCVNAGALMVAGVVASGSPEKETAESTQDLMDLWMGLSGGIGEVRFSEETMLSERATAHRNFAMAYLLQGSMGLPRNVDLNKMMDLYLSCCSIEMTADMLSVAAATLANGGVCPITGRQVLSTDVVKKTLAVMQFAGMYDGAGLFTLQVGLPAKSGVSGAVMVVVPNVMGFATFSPRLDVKGNSVRGVSFFKELVGQFTFHVFDSLSGGRTGCKKDPRESQYNRKQRDLSDLRWALAYGDRQATKVYDLVLSSMIDICLADGEIEEPEIEVISSTAEDLLGSAVPAAALEVMARSRLAATASSEGSTPFDALVTQLAKDQPIVDDNARHLILEAAFRVACSDGEVEEQEYERLARIADALGIHRGILEMEIHRFQRRLSTDGTS